MHTTKQCLIRWHKIFALTKRFLSCVIHNKNFNTAQINPTNETRFDKTKGRVWNLIQGQQFWIHLTKFDSTTRKRNCQYDIRLAVTKNRFFPWYVATKCNTHQENLILASIPPSYPITLMLHDCITYFFIVTFTLHLNVKIYNHQVILIDASPGKTKNGSKI